MQRRYDSTVVDDDSPAAAPAAKKSRIDVWVCGGRVCRSHGADAVHAACVDDVAARGDARLRVLRGGCYGLCDLGANVVARFVDTAVDEVDDVDEGDNGNVVDAIDDDAVADRLTLRGGLNEHVACGVSVTDVDALLTSLVTDARVPERLQRAVREATSPPTSPIEAKMRALRARRAAASSSSSSSPMPPKNTP